MVYKMGLWPSSVIISTLTTSYIPYLTSPYSTPTLPSHCLTPLANSHLIFSSRKPHIKMYHHNTHNLCLALVGGLFFLTEGISRYFFFQDIAKQLLMDQLWISTCSRNAPIFAHRRQFVSLTGYRMHHDHWQSLVAELPRGLWEYRTRRSSGLPIDIPGTILLCYHWHLHYPDV